MKTARTEYGNLVARQRVARAKKTKPTTASESKVAPSDIVYVYREKLKRWVGPIPCAHRDDKQVFVDLNGTLKPFNISQIKRAEIENPNRENTCIHHRNHSRE